MLSRHNLTGFSLIEAVMATFLLLSAVLLGAYVFHSGLRAEASNERRVVASMVAESAMAEIRESANRNFQGLVTGPGERTWSPTEEPEMKVTMRVRPVSLALVCQELESQYPRANRFPAPAPRLLSESVVEVEIAVSWSDSTQQSIRLVETITNLRTAEEFTVQLLGASGNGLAESMALSKGGTVDFTAQATADGQPVKDIQFTWYVQPLIGFGSLTAVSRDGSRCTYINAYRNYNDDLRYAPGACYLMLKASYQGRESTARIRIDNE